MRLRKYFTKKIELIACHFPILLPLFLLYYKKTINREIKLGKIAKDDKVLFIGGGPLPWSALQTAKKTGATVKIIDNCPLAIEYSQQVIDDFDANELVNVDYGDGTTIDPKKFTVICIAKQACPQQEILENIWCNCQKGARIIVRQRPEKIFKSFNIKKYVKLYFPWGDEIKKHDLYEQGMLVEKH